MAKKPITEQEAAKLNEAIKTLHNFCASRSACKDCPFRKKLLSLTELCASSGLSTPSSGTVWKSKKND